LEVGETTESERGNELVSTALHNLGALKVQTGHTETGAALLSRSLDLKTQFLGADHPSVVQSRANLSTLLADMGRVEQAGLVRGGLSSGLTTTEGASLLLPQGAAEAESQLDSHASTVYSSQYDVAGSGPYNSEEYVTPYAPNDDVAAAALTSQVSVDGDAKSVASDVTDATDVLVTPRLHGADTVRRLSLEKGGWVRMAGMGQSVLVRGCLAADSA